MTREEIRIIITKYGGYVYGICLNFTKNAADAENLTQETFISAYTHPSLTDESKYKAYLAKIAVNKCKDHLKSAYMRRVYPESDLASASRHTSSAGLPEKTLLEREAVHNIKKEILALKEPYRLAAILYFLKEKNISEIAEILQRPPNTVSTQLFRARNILKEKLSQRKEE